MTTDDPTAPSGSWPVPLPTRLRPTHAVRGTLLHTSRAKLRAAGLYEAYDAHLSPESRSALDGSVAASWVPVPLAEAHFTAADALGLTDAEVFRLTNASAEALHELFLSTAVRLLRSTGVTPWTAMPALSKLWGRLFEGGALAVQKVGPKDARIVIAAHPLVRFHYHRTGLRSHAERAIGICASRVFVTETSVDLAHGGLVLLARWV